MIRTLLLSMLGLALSACGPRHVASLPERPAISPQDFALVPCGMRAGDAPCVIVVAGGKRILFGAPAGVAGTITKDDLAKLDAVMLFSLRAADIEGLDEVRNASWRAGRSEPLLVAGPEGTDAVVSALNLAFEQADALRIVEEGIPPGGYDAAVLYTRTLTNGQPVFDTGDLRVDSLADAAYAVTYDRDTEIAIQACKVEASEAHDLRTLGCGSDVAWSWPLEKIEFVK